MYFVALQLAILNPPSIFEKFMSQAAIPQGGDFGHWWSNGEFLSYKGLALFRRDHRRQLFMTQKVHAILKDSNFPKELQSVIVPSIEFGTND